MVTLVGTQGDFIKAVKELLELEYCSLEIYEAVIHRLQNENFKSRISAFKKDHENHITEISRFLTSNNVDFTKGPSGKQVLKIGEVAIREITGGDESILKAMIGAEEDNIKAYERMLEYKDELSTQAQTIFLKGLSDEKMHRDWIVSVTNSN